MQERLTRISARFSAIYREKWTKRLTDDRQRKLESYEWARAVHDLSESQIEYAFDCLGEYHPSWPPTCLEFRNLAFGGLEGQAVLGTSYRADRTLTHERRTPTAEEAREYLRKAREALKQ